MPNKPNTQTLPLNAEALNAITSAMGAFVMCLSRQLTEDQRAGLRADLSRIAQISEQNGDTLLETLLIDLHRAV